MYYNILDKKRIDILPLLKNFKDNFYLAGGTALALQLGHRDSIDFDFFSIKAIDTEKLFQKIKTVFVGHKILKVQEEKNTLTVYIDKNIQLSFLFYPYKLIKPLINESYLNLASLNDISAMKLSAITGRVSNKDYIDIYFILKKMSLEKLLKSAAKKFPELDKNLILKSLVYFEDMEDEPIRYKNNNKIAFSKVKKTLIKKIKKFIK